MKILRSSEYDAIKSEILSRGDLDYKDINITVEEIRYQYYCRRDREKCKEKWRQCST